MTHRPGGSAVIRRSEGACSGCDLSVPLVVGQGVGKGLVICHVALCLHDLSLPGNLLNYGRHLVGPVLRQPDQVTLDRSAKFLTQISRYCYFPHAPGHARLDDGVLGILGDQIHLDNGRLHSYRLNRAMTCLVGKKPISASAAVYKQKLQTAVRPPTR